MERMDYEQIREMLVGCCERIIRCEPYLSKVDSAIGDGDHGTGMMVGSKAALRVLEEGRGGDDVFALYARMGQAMQDAMGGASGMIFSTLYVGDTAGHAPADGLSCADLLEVMEGGLAAIKRVGGAEPGDKTMVDALQPAVEAMRAHVDEGFGAMLDAARDAANVSPLGAAALAGTTYPLDRAAVAEALGMDGVIPNSMDAVSDRDFALDLLYACAVCQVHLSRLCEELVLWCSAEFGFVEMDDSHSTGSSIMPQKKNPDFAELVRGKTGRVVGDLTSLLVTLKGTPLTYDKDLQEDKEGTLDACDTLLHSLHAVEGMVRTMHVREGRMREASHEGYMAATDLADYLVGRGMPFREAHAVVGRIVAECVARGVTLQELSLDELRAHSGLFEEDALAAIDVDEVVRRRTTYGGTGHAAVEAQLAEARAALEALAG